MLSFIKRLRNDRRGNVLAITAAALPLVIGSAGLATDTIQWAGWKRQLQRAADSAAFAGVYEKVQGGSVGTAVDADLAKKLSNAGIEVLAGYPKLGSPTSGAYSHAVQVTLATQKTLSFSSFFMPNAPVITTSATAALVEEGEYCAWALYKGSAAPAISIGGSSNTNLGCPVISNGSGANSVKVDGTAHKFISPEVVGAGGVPTTINGVTKTSPYRMPQPDPFEDQYPTEIPEWEKPCKNLPNNQTTISPGCYKDFKFTGSGTYTLQDGVYYLDSADFDVQGGATIKGDNVTIILTGDTPGSIKLNGSATIKLTAPTSGTYEKMLFIQSADALADNSNTINGSSASKFDGAMYFPKGLMNFSGSNATTTKCVMVVAYKLDFTGSSNIQNDKDGCKAAKSAPSKQIRLIA